MTKKRSVPPNSMAALLASWVEHRPLTVAAAAKLLNVKERTMYRWLAGKSLPPSTKLPRIAAETGHPLNLIEIEHQIERANRTCTGGIERACRLIEVVLDRIPNYVPNDTIVNDRLEAARAAAYAALLALGRSDRDDCER